MTDERKERLHDVQELLKKGEDNLTKEEREYVYKSLEQIGRSIGEDIVKHTPGAILTRKGLILHYAQHPAGTANHD